MKSARDEILKKLRDIKVPLSEKPDFEEPVFYTSDENSETIFKKNLEGVNGKVYLFQSEKELYSNLKLYLEQTDGPKIDCREPEIQARLSYFGISYNETGKKTPTDETAITSCEYLIAQTGSVMVSANQPGARQIIAFPEKHVIIAKKQQLVKDLDACYRAIDKQYKGNLPSQITLITGPSRTADIEKVLTIGAHGPKELHVFLY